MKLPLVLFSIFAVRAGNIGVKYCEISGDDPTEQCYVKETLVAMTHSPNQLSVDKYSNTLYFSFDAGQGEYIVAIYKIETKELTVLQGVNDAFAISIDVDTREVYFGGSHGIYKYNPILKSLKRLNIKHLDIWWIFFKEYVYFIKFPSLNTYYYDNGTIRTVEELNDNVVHQMVIDFENYKFFNNNSGLYGIKREAREPVLLRDNPRFLNMATDNNGYVHVCSEDGIYMVSKIIQKVKKIWSIQGVLGFTFDKSNYLIYSNSHELVRLIPVKGPSH